MVSNGPFEHSCWVPVDVLVHRCYLATDARPAEVSRADFGPSRIRDTPNLASKIKVYENFDNRLSCCCSPKNDFGTMSFVCSAGIWNRYLRRQVLFALECVEGHTQNEAGLHCFVRKIGAAIVYEEIAPSRIHDDPRFQL